MQKRLSSSVRNNDIKLFANLVFQGKTNTVMNLLSESNIGEQHISMK